MKVAEIISIASLSRIGIVLVAVQISVVGVAEEALNSSTRLSDPANQVQPPADAIGYPDRSAEFDALPGFRNPPPGYGEVPFWWWTGRTWMSTACSGR